MKMKEINIGTVGYKFMGRVHSNALARLPMFFDCGANVNMKTLCGRDSDQLSEAAHKLGWESIETSWENLVCRSDIDIIDITTPSNAHREIAVEAAKNGKHVFCEKPLALNLADARIMLEAVQKAGVKHQIGFNYRFVPAIQLAKKIISEGKIGSVRRVNACYLQDYLTDAEYPFVWRLKKSICGSGALGDLASHFIDLTRFLVGEFKSVMAMQQTFTKKRPHPSSSAASCKEYSEVDVDDSSVFIAELECGALGIFEATRIAAGHKNGLSIEISGDKGTLRFDFERMNELQFFSFDDDADLQGFRKILVSEPLHPYMKHWWPAGHVIGYEHTFVHEFYEFIRSITEDTPTSPDFSDGVECSRVLEAAELSAGRRTAVDIASL